uniref:7TM_GPCR_Srx domain-containing protein n=1 Tax=Caenorhabditis japonica TaxID=281687 RepID=A0A8R1ICJ6_CAEJA
MAVGSNAVMDENISASRKRRRRKMFVQCVIQDCTHTFDCMVNTYVYALYSAQWFQFLCGAVSALTAILLDGFLMSVLHQKSGTPSQTREPPSKSHTFLRSQAASTFVTATTL